MFDVTKNKQTGNIRAGCADSGKQSKKEEDGSPKYPWIQSICQASMMDGLPGCDHCPRVWSSQG